jgi:hypothetical protein
MRKFNAILLFVICFLLSSSGHGKGSEKQAINIPVIQEKTEQHHPNTVHAATLFDDTVIPPLLILMVVPT